MKRELKKILMKALVYGGKPTMLFFEKDIDKIMDRTAQAIIDRLEIDEKRLFEIICKDFIVYLKHRKHDRLNELEEVEELIEVIAKEKPIKVGGLK